MTQETTHFSWLFISTGLNPVAWSLLVPYSHINPFFFSAFVQEITTVSLGLRLHIPFLYLFKMIYSAVGGEDLFFLLHACINLYEGYAVGI